MLSKIKYYYNIVSDKYFVEILYLQKKPGETIPWVASKEYLIYNDKDSSIDYTKDVNRATCFGFIMGSLIVKKLNKENANYPDLKASMVSAADAMFIETVTGGAAVGYQKTEKTAVDFAAESLVKELKGFPGLYAICTDTEMNTVKKTILSVIELYVKDEQTKKKLEEKYSDHLYKKFPIKIIVGNVPTPNKK